MKCWCMLCYSSVVNRKFGDIGLLVCMCVLVLFSVSVMNFLFCGCFSMMLSSGSSLWCSFFLCSCCRYVSVWFDSSSFSILLNRCVVGMLLIRLVSVWIGLCVCGLILKLSFVVKCMMCSICIGFLWKCVVGLLIICNRWVCMLVILLW